MIPTKGKMKPIKAWAYYGKKFLKGKLLAVNLEKPNDRFIKDYVEVEIRPVNNPPTKRK